MVRQELQTAWSARMSLLLNQIKGPVVLLWFADHAPSNEEDSFSDPLFVTADMVNELSDKVSGVVEVTASDRALRQGTEGMMFSPVEEGAAREMMGPIAHEEAANALTAELAGILHHRH